MEYLNDELYHFGVPGMKWGVKKSTYKSMSSAQKKSTKDKFKADKAAYDKKYKEKYKKYKKSQSMGKRFLKTALIGPLGKKTYDQLRMANNTRVSSFLKTVATGYLLPVGGMAMTRNAARSVGFNEKTYGKARTSKTMSSNFVKKDNQWGKSLG